jgi:hypothetical protein
MSLLSKVRSELLVQLKQTKSIFTNIWKFNHANFLISLEYSGDIYGVLQNSHICGSAAELF